MNRAEYDAIPAVNYSLLRTLAVSPLHAWAAHINPKRKPQEPTSAMDLGQALHCAVLQPKEFDKRYCSELDPPADVLDTMDDMRTYCRDAGLVVPAARNKRKADLVDWLHMHRPSAPILEILQSRHAAANAGKQMFKTEDWHRVAGMAVALAEEPEMRRLLAKGEPEKCLQATDADTGLRLKGLLDWAAPGWIVDCKTFSVKHGRTVDRSIADAIFYERYYLQAVFYSKLKGYPEWKGDYVLAFVESEEPHETRLRAIRPRGDGGANVLWQRGAIEIRSLLRLYKECMDHFGVDKPWRYACEVTAVADEEIPGVMY
jgi:PDDEXK-like domain of unknown function (DUF3799)